MTKREQFVDYVRNGGDPVCSPQIGAGAGFDSKLAGKETIWDTSVEDTIAAVERFDMLPLVNVGLPDWSACPGVPAWREVETHMEGTRTYRTEALDTPVGSLSRTTMMEARAGYQTKHAVTTPDDLTVLEYVIDSAIGADMSAFTTHTRAMVELVAGRAALSVQWPLQPYELLCYPSTQDTALIVHDCPARCLRIMERLVELGARAIRAVAAGGGDFVFLGGPGAEMISPRYYRDYLVPFSQQVTAAARAEGMLIYSHICSPIEPFLTMGFYNQMGIDLFETLSPPPVGNVPSLTHAMERIDPSICTRGNIGLDVMLNGTPDEIAAATRQALAETAGRKHMMAASDYLFYDVPEANVHAMCAAVREASASQAGL